MASWDDLEISIAPQLTLIGVAALFAGVVGAVVPRKYKAAWSIGAATVAGVGTWGALVATDQLGLPAPKPPTPGAKAGDPDFIDVS